MYFAAELFSAQSYIFLAEAADLFEMECLVDHF
jgi:hypothetical protein